MKQFYLNSSDALLMRSTELFPCVPNLPSIDRDRGVLPGSTDLGFLRLGGLS